MQSPRTLAPLLVIALVACSAVERLADSPAPPARAAASMQRQYPAWSPAQTSRLQTIVRGALRSPYFGSAGIAIAAADGRILYARNASHSYAPASTMKTLVAAAALGLLGNDAHLDTTFESLERPDPQGTIDDLWLVGSGDPVLDPEQLRGGIGELYRHGVRRIEGDLLVDASSFSGPEQNPAWAADDFENSYAAGTSAISLNWNVIEFKIAPTRVGAPARVRVFPPDPSIVVHGSPLTGYETNFRIDRTVPGRNEFEIAGTIAAGSEQSYFRPVAGIPLWAGHVAAAMLRERGIELTGEVRLGGDPLATQTLWEHRSPPLGTLVKQMMFESDNHIAEQLLRVLGARSSEALSVAVGEENGARAERAYLSGIGVPVPGLRIVDGSGLAEKDRVAPVTFVRLLQAVARLPFGDVYVNALPRAGIEGTVRRHYLVNALGRVRAKSGHIADVNALVGYVDTRGHGRLAFAFLVNAPGADDAISIQAGIDRALDELCAAL